MSETDIEFAQEALNKYHAKCRAREKAGLADTKTRGRGEDNLEQENANHHAIRTLVLDRFTHTNEVDNEPHVNEELRKHRTVYALGLADKLSVLRNKELRVHIVSDHLLTLLAVDAVQLTWRAQLKFREFDNLRKRMQAQQAQHAKHGMRPSSAERTRKTVAAGLKRIKGMARPFSPKQRDPRTEGGRRNQLGKAPKNSKEMYDPRSVEDAAGEFLAMTWRAWLGRRRNECLRAARRMADALSSASESENEHVVGAEVAEVAEVAEEAVVGVAVGAEMTEEAMKVMEEAMKAMKESTDVMKGAEGTKGVDGAEEVDGAAELGLDFEIVLPAGRKLGMTLSHNTTHAVRGKIGCKVTHVDEGGAAVEAAGQICKNTTCSGVPSIIPSDWIIGVNGTDVSDDPKDDVDAVIKAAMATGESVTMRFRRSEESEAARVAMYLHARSAVLAGEMKGADRPVEEETKEEGDTVKMKTLRELNDQEAEEQKQGRHELLPSSSQEGPRDDRAPTTIP